MNHPACRRAFRLSRGLLALLALAPSVARAQEASPAPSPAPCERPLFGRPESGPVVGCLGGALAAHVLERVPGWLRVQIEGWIEEPMGASLPAPAGKAALAGSAARADGAPAAGAQARLLRDPEALDVELAALRERREGDRDRIRQRLVGVDQQLERVLFSDDNLTRMQESRRRLRSEREALEQERLALRRKALEEILAVLERHQAGSSSLDTSGFFLLEGIEPGTYRLLVSSGSAADGPTWYVPLSLSPGERRRLDLSGPPSSNTPFSGLD